MKMIARLDFLWAFVAIMTRHAVVQAQGNHTVTNGTITIAKCTASGSYVFLGFLFDQYKDARS